MRSRMMLITRVTPTTTMVTTVMKSRCYSSTFTAPSHRRIIEEHGIVSIGGGPVGLALMAALATNPTIAASNKITMIEASSLLDKVQQWHLPPTEFSNRVSSITADNQLFLRRIGAWQYLDESRTRSIEEMQVWDGISSARITFEAPYSTTNTTSSALFPSIEPMATLVENLHLQRAILASIQQQQEQQTAKGGRGLEIVEGVKVLGIEEGEGGWPLVHLEGRNGGPERFLRARLLIGADGHNSPVRTYSKIDTFGWAYDANGLVASMRVADENAGEGMTTAWQRFLPQGPIAFLPMSNTVASLVWSTTPEIASSLKQLPYALLPSLINAAFTMPYTSLRPILDLLQAHDGAAATAENVVGQASAVEIRVEEMLRATEQQRRDDRELAFSSSLLSNSPHAEEQQEEDDELFPPSVIALQPSSLASFPLRLSHADSYLGLPTQEGRDRRTCLVGDAAHTVHPMAGQGMNMGLGDVRALVETLEEAVRRGGDVGAYNSLRPYPRSRYLANHLILSATDHLSTLYASKSPFIIWARSTGLELINELDSLKGMIMKQAGAGGKDAQRREEAGGWGKVVLGFEAVAEGLKMAKMIGQVASAEMGRKVGELAGRANPRVMRRP